MRTDQNCRTHSSQMPLFACQILSISNGQMNSLLGRLFVQPYIHGFAQNVARPGFDNILTRGVGAEAEFGVQRVQLDGVVMSRTGCGSARTAIAIGAADVLYLDRAVRKSAGRSAFGKFF